MFVVAVRWLMSEAFTALYASVHLVVPADSMLALNDIVARTFTSARVLAVKEPNGLTRVDGKRPDG